MPLRTHQSHIIEAFRAETHADLRQQSGINGLALILKLTTLRVPESFPLDLMHLLYQGAISRVLIPLFAGNFWKENSPMNRSDRGKTPQQVQQERARAEREGRTWTEADDDGVRVPLKIWERMGGELAVS
jgi:hypothetical protein